MVQLFLIGIAAGAASALLFASIASGAVIALLLCNLATLPILIAALGWHHIAGLIAAVTAAAALAAIFDGFFFITFMVGVGFPAWWLGYLAVLARPGAQPGELEWYPVGRLVVWAAVLGACVVTVAILNFGTDADTFRAGLRRAFERFIRIHTPTGAEAPLEIPGVPDPNRFIDMMVVIVPPIAAMLSATTNLVNLWLAARIVKLSGRLRRPWPDLAEMRFPPMVAAAFAIAFVGNFVAGIVNIISGVFAATLLLAYVILGFAIVHRITIGMTGRGLILVGVYVAVLVLQWPLIVMALLGLADAAIDIRNRFAPSRGPPAPRT